MQTNVTQLFSIFIATILSHSAPAQQNAPPKLEPVFSDDFSTDTRGDYSIDGNASWQPGKLTLAEGASMTRDVNGGAWSRIRLDFASDTRREPPTINVRLYLDGARDILVSVAPNNSAGSSEVEVALFNLDPSLNLRRIRIPGPLPSSIAVENRWGLITVWFGEEAILSGHVDYRNKLAWRESDAELSIARVTASGAPCAITRLTAQAIPHSPPLTEVQQRQSKRIAEMVDEVMKAYAKGDFARAVEANGTSIALRKVLLGPWHPDVGQALSDQAYLLNRVGRKRAPLITMHERAVRTLELSVGKRHADYATAVNNLGALHSFMGQYSKAEHLYRTASETWELALGDRSELFATSLHNLGHLHMNLGKYSQAKPYLLRALEIWRHRVGEDDAVYAKTLASLAVLYFTTGDYVRAESACQRVIAIRGSVLGKDHPDYAGSLSQLGRVYSAMGQFGQALPLLEESLEICRSSFGKHHIRCVVSLHRLAELRARMGDADVAEQLFLEALDVRRERRGGQPVGYADSLDGLALLYKESGQLARAEPLLRTAIDIRRDVQGNQHIEYARSVYELAGLMMSLRQAERASPLYRRSLAIQRGYLNRTSVIESSRQQQREQTRSRQFLDDRISNAVALSSPATEVLADLWQWKGAVTLRQKAYREVGSLPHLAAFFTELQSVSRELSALSSDVPRPPAVDGPEDQQAIYEQQRELWDSRFAELRNLREELERRIAAGSVDYRQIREPLTSNKVSNWMPDGTAFVECLEYTHRTPDPKQPWEFDAQRRLIAFVVRPDREPVMIALPAVAELSAAITDFRQPFIHAEVADADVQSSQAAGRLLRELLWLPLEQHLDNIQTVIISPDTVLGSLPFAALPGRELGSYLVEDYRIATLPMAGMLRSLFDGEKERPLPESGLLVLGDVDYSGGGLLTQTKDAPTRPAWMRSAPRSGEAIWQSLPGFQAELAVVRDLFESRFGGDVTVLRQSAATEAAFLREAPKHHNLHLITHGFFAAPEVKSIVAADTDDRSSRGGSLERTELGRNDNINEYLPGLLSGLVMAGANNPPSDESPEVDGILTAAEIETLNLNAVDLVVLSACETGLGKVAGGEGLTGLQRAFHIAGARSCISTLWKVDDKATQEIMSRFYRYYWHDGQSKIDALRNAQLDVLRNPSLTRGLTRKTKQVDPTKKAVATVDRTDPFFWAAFQLSGDWR